MYTKCKVLGEKETYEVKIPTKCKSLGEKKAYEVKIPTKCKSLGEKEAYEVEKTKKKIIDVGFGEKGNFKKKKAHKHWKLWAKFQI